MTAVLCPWQDYFDKGDYIIREGEEGDTFFIIAKGEVSENVKCLCSHSESDMYALQQSA